MGETDKIVRDGDENSIKKIYDNYQENLRSIYWYFQKFSDLAIDEDENIINNRMKEFEDAIVEAGINKEEINEAEAEEKISLSKEQIDKFIAAISRNPIRISPKNYELLSRSSFLMLNSFFEYLQADLLTFYYFKYQNSLSEKEFKASLREINEHDSVDSLVKSMIHKEIDSMLVDMTFSELLGHFESKLGINLEKELIDWNSINEARERRHIIVHNSSRVNKKYILRTSNPYGLELNSEVEITKDYFLKFLYEFQFAGIMLIYNCWGNWVKEDADSAIYEMMQQSFNYLVANKNELALKLCQYCERIDSRNSDQEDMLLRIMFNKCIAIKRIGDKKELESSLKKIRVGTSSPIFKIAYQILADDHTDLMENLRKSMTLDEIGLKEYLEWPIFEFVRNNTELNAHVLGLMNEK